MSVLIPPKKRYYPGFRSPDRKPTGSVVLDRASPRPEFALPLVGSDKDLTGNYAPESTSSGFGFYSHYLDFDGTGNAYDVNASGGFDTIVPVDEPIAIFLEVGVSTTSQRQIYFADWDVGGSPTGYSLFFEQRSGNDFRFGVRTTVFNPLIFGNVSAGRNRFLLYHIPGEGAGVCYKNQIFTTSFSGNRGNGTDVRLGRGGAFTGSRFTGNIHGCYIWGGTKALSIIANARGVCAAPYFETLAPAALRNSAFIVPAEPTGSSITANVQEEGDVTTASLQSVASVTANVQEEGDVTTASLQSVASLTANIQEEGDVTTAAFRVTAESSITANVQEDGDTTTAALQLVAQVTANAQEEGDVTTAAFRTVLDSTITANVQEEGDVTTAALSSVGQITANVQEEGDTTVANISTTQIAGITANVQEDGDVTTASLQTVARLSANVQEEGDTTVASLQVVVQLSANVQEEGDTTTARFRADVTAPRDITRITALLPGNIEITARYAPTCEITTRAPW